MEGRLQGLFELIIPERQVMKPGNGLAELRHICTIEVMTKPGKFSGGIVGLLTGGYLIDGERTSDVRKNPPWKTVGIKYLRCSMGCRQATKERVIRVMGG
jgi:uncharacterized protein YneF (UPF0154 family)